MTGLKATGGGGRIRGGGISNGNVNPGRGGRPDVDPPWWEALSRRSDQAEAREEIARLIRLGEVSVRPLPGDPERVEVIPVHPHAAKTRSKPGGPEA